LHGAAPEEEGDGAAAASFDGEGGARWTAAEELWLSKGLPKTKTEIQKYLTELN
jgi:hypothetical protein